MNKKKYKRQEIIKFNFAEIVVEVKYSLDADNRLSYSSHRRMEPSERAAIESWLLSVYAPEQTMYHEYTPATFIYHGIDKNVLVKYNKAQEAIVESAIDKKDIDAAVAELKRKAFGDLNLDGKMN